MKTVIYKYPIVKTMSANIHHCEVEVPNDFTIRHLDWSYASETNLCMWGSTDPSTTEKKTLKIIVAFTGAGIDINHVQLKFLGTIINATKDFVLHVWQDCR